MMRRSKEAGDPRRPEFPWLAGAMIGLDHLLHGDRRDDAGGRAGDRPGRTRGSSVQTLSTRSRSGCPRDSPRRCRW